MGRLLRVALATLLAVGMAHPALAEQNFYAPSSRHAGYDTQLAQKGLQALSVTIGGRFIASLDDRDPVPGAPPVWPIRSIHQWPGLYFIARFRGDKVAAAFDDDTSQYALSIDGGPRILINKPGDRPVWFTTSGKGKHTVRLEKISESMGHSGAFGGFFVLKPAKPLPAPPSSARQVELIGDSYAAGYGTTSTKHECTADEIHDTTDTQQAFGALLGKHYDADYQINAVSGIGMVRNYDDSPGDVMPALYPYTLFDKSITWSDPSWNPQVVVIALGDNDFATPVKAGGKWADETALTSDFVTTYVRFVEDARKTHPRAIFILMDYGEPQLIPALAQIAAQLKTDGDNRILTWSAGTGFEQTGCDWHLSLNDHKRIASGLEAFIDAQADIWNGN